LNAKEEMDKIAKEILTCTRCELYIHRKKAVPGMGALNSKIVLVGEAPGREEDESGFPFVGRGGKILEASLGELGVKRSDVYITNVVKCRPPKNRRPKSIEVLSCLPYLEKEVLFINPTVIVLLGATAATYLYDESLPLTKLPRAKKLEKIRGIPGQTKIQGRSFTAVATYHPAAVLRNKKLKAKFLEDLKLALDLARFSCSSV
jgi:DNA polymerase